VYSPVVFGKKTDPEGEYIKRYLPQLAKYPAKYIYSPWEAPLSVQKAAGCIIGKLLVLIVVQYRYLTCLYNVVPP
jgi:cryptochrome